MMLSSFLVKNTSTIIPAVVSAVAVSEHGLAVDPIIVASVGIGLIAGAMWRVGDMASDKRNWADIRGDLIVSSFTGLANAIIAMVIIDRLQAGPLFSLGIAAVVGASGTQAIKWVLSAVREKIKGSRV